MWAYRIYLTGNDCRNKILKLRHEVINHPVHEYFLWHFKPNKNERENTSVSQTTCNRKEHLS
jgi:hypothetical protein